MKNLLLPANILPFYTGSQNQENKQPATGHASKTDEPDEILYACPMHPEIKGKLNDKCPLCGMALTVLAS